MNNFRDGCHHALCYFHPGEVVVGVCAACLREKLLVLASKQGHGAAVVKEAHCGSFSRVPSRKPFITMPKVFALGSSLLHRLDSRHRRRPGDESDDDGGSVLSLDDSFISIKFEGDGRFSWDKKKEYPNSKPSTGTGPSILPPPRSSASGDRSIVEHARPRGGGDGGGGGGIRWRSRIGHLFQLVSWRRSSKAGSCRAGLPGNVEAGERRGWMRSLPRRATG